METFETGVLCCWSGHKFISYELGMKCLTCGKVMTNQSWEEKRRCFNGHTNSVVARAIDPMPLRNPRRTLPQDRNERRFQNPTVRPKLQWREANSVKETRQQLQWRDAKTNKWKPRTILCIGLIIIITIIIFLLKK